MDFEKLFKELKEEITQIAKDRFGDQANDIIKDMEDYLAESKEKIKKWSLLFVDGKIDKDELEWLLKSQKDILVLKTLRQAGVGMISIGHFKNKVIDTVLEKLVSLTNNL
ncbi:MAG: hypothetical protein HRT68_05120 [Flavobacteriaceae bacterium]|nr:hypothetical protein [Flavobacteriaceae bacterium]